MTVIVEGEKSEVKCIWSGVPQGSVLGTLIIIFINDLPDNIKSKLKLFTDSDQKLIGDVSCPDTIVRDLKELENWESIWLIKFNPSKCKVLHVDINDNPKLSYIV